VESYRVPSQSKTIKSKRLSAMLQVEKFNNKSARRRQLWRGKQ